MPGLLFLERGAEDAGEIADVLGDQEVVLHEAFDRRQAGMRRVAQPLRDLALDVEMQPLLRLAGEEVHVAAHRPQEILGLLEFAIFGLGEDAFLDQFLAGAHAIEIFADPEQCLQVAQAALAVLDVGLDQIAALARLGMALVAFGELGLDIFGSGGAHHLVVEAGQQFVKELAFAPQEARFQDRGADGDVGARQPQAFLDVAGGVADLEPHVPQHVEHVFDDLLTPRRLLVGKQEQEVDVGAGRQRAAPIAADRDDRHALSGRAVLDPVDMGRGEIVERPDQLIHKMRQPFGAGIAAAILLQHRFGDLSPLAKPALEQLEDGRARGLAGAVAGARRRQRRHVAAQGFAIDDFVEFQGDLGHSAASIACFRGAVYGGERLRLPSCEGGRFAAAPAKFPKIETGP